MSDAPQEFELEVSERIRELALNLPEATEGSSCVNRSFKAGGKNFAFLGERDGGCGLRLKLADSGGDVERLAETDPEHYEVGAHGWTMLRCTDDHHPPIDDLRRWVTESYRLLAPKRLAATTD